MDASPLNNLPAELRLEIYSLVLVQEQRIGLSAHPGKTSCIAVLENKQHLALTETCKLVRQESLPTFYRMNGFFFNTAARTPNCRWGWTTAQLFGRDAREFRGWIDSIGSENAALIRSLTFELGLVVASNRGGFRHYEDARIKRWTAAQRGAEQLAASGLSKKCDIHARITLIPSDMINFHCLEESEMTELRSLFSFTVPTKDREEARAKVHNVVSLKRKEYEAHAHHGCDIGVEHDLMIRDLEGGRAMLLSAICGRGEDEAGG